MKKLISIMLCVLLAVGLFAGCDQGTGDAQPQAGVFSVGFGREDISPYDFSVPMHGYGDSQTRLSTEVIDPIYTTCVAIRDAGGNTILQFHNDLCGTGDVILLARKDISDATGIPMDNIMMASTHTHHSVSIGSSMDIIAKYNKMLREWMLNAAVAAIADLKPAQMYITSIETEGLNFVRHYIMNDGTVAGDNFGNHSSGAASHVTDPDRVLQLVKFTREGGKDVIMANFQTHPHRAGSTANYNGITSDLVGAMRTEVETLLNCKFAYFSGASGNVNPSSYMSSENAAKDYIEQGEMLAEYAVEAAANFTQVQTGNVQMLHDVCQPEPKEEGKTASEIDLYVYSIGDVAFVNAPYEMFSGNGEQIKEGSPFAMTFIATLSNRSMGYIPTYEGYEYDGVLSYGANAGNYARGTGELLAEEYVSMLEELYKTK